MDQTVSEEQILKGTIDSEWLATEIAVMIYSSSRKEIFDVLECIYEKERDPRLSANKKLVSNILNKTCKNISKLIADVLENWEVEVEVGGKISPEETLPAIREYNNTRGMIGLPPILRPEVFISRISEETNISPAIVKQILDAETELIIERVSPKKL